MTALRLNNVTMTFGQGETACTALREVSLDVESGEFVSVVGPSGSGKTTLLNLAAGLCRPTNGRIELLGQDLAKLREGGLAQLFIQVF